MIEERAPITRVTAVALVDRLAEALHQHGVAYCHWKSNIDLAEAASGRTDLDLLVERTGLGEAVGILAGLGFREAVSRWAVDPPGIRHFYGMDPETHRLVHVHLFSRVLTGESLVKSHLLPFESLLLENGRYVGALRVATKPAEMVLYTLRMFIKYGSPLDLLTVGRRSAAIREEVRWLQDGAGLDEPLALLREHCPVIDEGLFRRCVATLEGGAGLPARVLLAWRVRRRLGVYAKHAPLERLLAYGRLFWGEALRRLIGPRGGKVLRGGGAVIAVVGADATGKSTIVRETERWLNGPFAVRTVHAGKPPSTWLTVPLNLALPLLRRRAAGLRTGSLEGHLAPAGEAPGGEAPAGEAPDRRRGLAALVYAVRAVAAGWDRRALLVRARRAAARGEFVVSDRYPSDNVGVMDSPRLTERPEARGVVGAMVNRLARLERRLYRDIPPPDIVLRLRVSLETAQKRNRERDKPGKESDAYVESRHRQTQEWRRSGARQVFDIDTESSLDETLQCVQRTIWEAL
jgi:thymidylate kinase